MTWKPTRVPHSRKARGCTAMFRLQFLSMGLSDIKLKDRTVKFYSFPQGTGTFMVASGSWTVDDLKQAIDQALSRTK